MMEIKTYRAATLQEALQLVRQELGPDAAVLRAREVAGSLWQRLRGHWQIEVTAATDVPVPPRIPRDTPGFLPTSSLGSPIASRPTSPATSPAISPLASSPEKTTQLARDFAPQFASSISPASTPVPSQPVRELKPNREIAKATGDGARRRALSPAPNRQWPMLDELCQSPRMESRMPASVFDLFVDLLDAELGDELARDLIEEARGISGEFPGDDPSMLKARLVGVMESRIPTSGPIACEPGRRRVVALVGPTGVGKTTTLAKLAANFRLRERRRVGLVTVDTYRIAAVQQLRTYAEIIDLPMEVVSTAGDMGRALERLGDCDLVLLDTAGRSPRDEVRIQELKSILEEARADEVHLVLSAASGSGPLRQASERFAPAGVTALLLTKLDEAATLGPAYSWLQRSGQRLSYVTHGQNVPDDIEVADAQRFARQVLMGNRASSTPPWAGGVSTP